jgi:hypothetical protein
MTTASRLIIKLLIVYSIAAISITFLISPNIAESKMPPPTGWKIKDSLGNGYGKLTVTNSNSGDAVVVLVDKMKAVYSAIYIRSGDTYTLDNIARNIYYLYFACGKDWDRDSNTFSDDIGMYRFIQPLEFEITESPEQIKYTIWQLSLPSVPEDAYDIESVSQSEFPVIN